MFQSLRWRITIPFVILILAAMLGVSLYVSNFVRRTYLADLEAMLFTEARMVGDIVTPQLLSRISPPDLDLDEAARHWAEILEARVTIIAPDGFVVGESHEDRKTMDNHLARPEVAAALASDKGSSTRFSHTVGYSMMYTAVAVKKEQELIGFARIALPLNQVEANVAHLQRVLLSGTLLAAALAVILAAYIAGRTSRPVRQLTKAVRQAGAGAVSDEPAPASMDEVGLLTQAFNEMLVQVKSQITALEAERGKLSAVLDRMTDGVLIVDNEGHVQLINPAAEKLFGAGKAHAIGLPLVEVIRHHAPVEMWQTCREIGVVQNASFELGSKKLYLQGVATMLGPILPGSVLLLFQDISRQRQTEIIRRDFISNVSHELRTPLAALKALAETLQDGALEDPPAARRFLERIETEIDSLSLMVNELLELSRIESGRVPLELAPTRPIDILQPAYERLRLQAERARLSLNLDCPEDLPIIMADSLRVQQVVVNLIHNAIKFTPGGGQVIVSAYQSDHSIQFAVRDTGIGISSEDLPRIFERFYKVDRSRAAGDRPQATSGTGLGLAIARHLVEAHGGEIWAESEPEIGSVFYFTIPIA